MVILLKLAQGGHGIGKTGNLAVNFSRQGKHREFSKFNFFTQGKWRQHRSFSQLTW